MRRRKSLRIAFMGIRGIPANYGGFETFAEEAAPRLVDRGHQVTVYGRSNNISYRWPFYKGVRIKVLPTISSKYMDTMVHTLLAAVHASLFEQYDVVLMMNAANAPFVAFPRIFGSKVVLNVDGIERMRKKWGGAGKILFWIGEYLATKLPHRIVSDAVVIHDYYLKKYGVKSTIIAYGAEAMNRPPGQTLRSLALVPREYVLYVTRLEQENNPDLLINAFRAVKTDSKLVVVGDAPYSSAFKKMLVDLARLDARVVLPGAIYGDGYRELLSNAVCYVQATEVGGTHPALIEAMAAGNCVIANDTPENREVLGQAGLFYRMNDQQDLSRQLEKALLAPSFREQLGIAARDRIEAFYSWDKIMDQYESLFCEIASSGTPAGER